MLEDNTIQCYRGDRKSLKLKSDTNFSVGDKIKFSIVEKGNYNEVVFQKEYTVTASSKEFVITLTSEDTTIGEVISKPTTYWYEIDYNNNQTLIGYDTEIGAKKFILLPEAPNKG